MVALGLFFAFWIGAASAVHWWHNRGSRSLGFYGMLCAHLGVAVFAIGVTLVKGYETDTELRMDIGDTARLAGYTFRFAGMREVRGPNYTAARGTVEVARDGTLVATLHPEKRLYLAQRAPMTESAIDAGLLRHLYVSLGEPLPQDQWLVRIHHKPFVSWIWIGCLLMALGGLLAVLDRRYRSAPRPAAAAVEAEVRA